MSAVTAFLGIVLIAIVAAAAYVIIRSVALRDTRERLDFCVNGQHYR